MDRRSYASSLGLALLLSLLAGCSMLHHGKAEAAPAPRRIIKLDSSVYNLADTPGPAYLRLGISLAVTTPASSDDSTLQSVAHDTLVNLVTAETSAQLLTEAGKTALKKAALAEIQKRLPNAQVQTIYLDEFLVQH